MSALRTSRVPAASSAGGDRSWAIAKSSVDLPQPDSPTIAEELPGLERQVDPVDRADVSRVGDVVDREAADLKQPGCHAASSSGGGPGCRSRRTRS